MTTRRTWINRTAAVDPRACVVWVSLGDHRWLYILVNGECGVDDRVDLLDLLATSSQWEELT